MTARWPVLVVDDEAIMRHSLAAWLAEDGYAVELAASGPEAVALAREKRYAVFLLDLKMPGGMDGLATMRALRALQADAAFVIITAYATVETAVAALKEGAADYLVKPCNPEEISRLLERVLRMRRLERDNRLLRRRLARRQGAPEIITKNPAMLELLDLVNRVASLRSTVLIQGESGTGKELVARAIHRAGARSGARFVAVACSALTETLLEAELFGHEKGAFTGAVARAPGKFEQADSGTLFLDEIGDIPAKLQADLLRVLQERRFYRVGGNQEVAVDVRVVAATHRDLQAEVREGRFREDLYYRLNVIAVKLPPLRDRREDIPLLARHFLERHAAESGVAAEELAPAALARLLAHDWPGNVRELENAIERAVVTCSGPTVEAGDLAFLGDDARGTGWVPPAGTTLRELERRAVEAALARAGGSVARAATELGIDRTTLYDKLDRWGVPRGRPRG